MVIIVTGASHTGKTALSQKLLEKYKYPYLSLDHLKMGLIRSGNTKLSVFDDELLTPYIWSIAKEIVKTAVENGQNLIIEGCYVPFDYADDFEPFYLEKIKFICLVMSRSYIENNFSDIERYADIIEKRLENDVSKQFLIKENEKNLKLCQKYGIEYILIDEKYDIKIIGEEF